MRGAEKCADGIGENGVSPELLCCFSSQNNSFQTQRRSPIASAYGEHMSAKSTTTRTILQDRPNDRSDCRTIQLHGQCC